MASASLACDRLRIDVDRLVEGRARRIAIALRQPQDAEVGVRRAARRLDLNRLLDLAKRRPGCP